MPVIDIVLIGLLTLVVSFLGTITGFGISTIMVPVLVLFFPLAQTLLLVGVIHWFSDIWKLTLFRKGINFKLILFFGVPGIIAAYIGARLVFNVSEILLLKILGTFLVIYAIFLLINPKFRIRESKITAVSGGVLSGFFAGIFGVGGAVRGAFLSMFNLKKAVYISTAGAIAFIIDITRVSTYLFEGARLSFDLLYGLLFFIPLSFVGAYTAKKVVDKIPKKYFRLVVAVFILIIGIRFFVF